MTGRAHQTITIKLIVLLICTLFAEALCLLTIDQSIALQTPSSVFGSVRYQPVTVSDAPILVLGTDADGLRTDVLMLAAVRKKDSVPVLLSLPRDTMVELEGNTEKLNAVYAVNGGGEEGVSALQNVLNEQLGIVTDRYVIVDLSAFEQLVDAIGGVWFDVPTEMHYADPSQNLQIDLSPGYQKLSGTQALGLVRYRNYLLGDIERTKMQQSFLKSVANQVCAEMTPDRMVQLCTLLLQHVRTDLSVSEAIGLAFRLSSCNLDQMLCNTLPGDGKRIHGVDYFCLFEDEAKTMISSMFYD